jgi:hypothetical protein
MSTHFYLSKTNTGPIPPRQLLGLSLDVVIEIGIQMHKELSDKPSLVLNWYVIKIEDDFQKSVPELFSGTEFSRNTESIDVDVADYKKISDIFGDLDPALQNLILNEHPDQVVLEMVHKAAPQVPTPPESPKVTVTRGEWGYPSDIDIPQKEDAVFRPEGEEAVVYHESLPVDDITRSFSNTLLPESMIDAGIEVYDRISMDLKDYISGLTTDWDSGMAVVAIYRAMTAAAQSSEDPNVIAARVLNQDRTEEQQILHDIESVSSQLLIQLMSMSDGFLRDTLHDTALKLSHYARRKMPIKHVVKSGESWQNTYSQDVYKIFYTATLRAKTDDDVANACERGYLVQDTQGDIIGILERNLEGRESDIKINPGGGKAVVIRSTVYMFLTTFELVDGSEQGLEHGVPLVIYQSRETGKILAQDAREFGDGRNRPFVVPSPKSMERLDTMLGEEQKTLSGKIYRHRERGNDYAVIKPATFYSAEGNIAWEGDPLIYLDHDVHTPLVILEKEFLARNHHIPRVGDPVMWDAIWWKFGGDVNLQNSKDGGIKSTDPMVIYKATEGPTSIWTRHREEFLDGRFQEISASS